MNQTLPTSTSHQTSGVRPSHPPDQQRFALLHGEWHADIVSRAAQGFLDEMARQGVTRESIDRYPVSGAFEAPLMARRLACSGRYAAIVACAFVIDGGVYRHDFVAATVVDALMRVQLETDTPVLSLVLTPHNYREGAPLAEFFGAHFVAKGVEAAQACRDTVARLAAV